MSAGLRTAAAGGYGSIARSLREVTADRLWCFPIIFKADAAMQHFDKLPLVPWKPWQDRRPDEITFAAWCRQFADVKGAATPTGPGTGIVAIDADSAKSEAHLKERGMPDTWQILTRRGRHYLFAYPPDIEIRISASAIAADVDVRGMGGMIVTPGSGYRYFDVETQTVQTFIYQWEPGHSPAELPLAGLPGWLLEWFREDAERRKPAGPPAAPRAYGGEISAWAQAVYDREIEELCSAEPGTRNDAANRVSFKLAQLCAAGELNEVEVLSALESIANSWPNSGHTISTVHNGFGAGLEKPRSAPPRPERPAPANLKIVIGGQESMDDEGDGRPADDDGAGASRIDWLLRHRIPLHEYSLIVADADTGRTNLMCYSGAHVSSGKPLFDGTPVAPGRVVVITDDWKRVVGPRLKANGACMDLIEHFDLGISIEKLEEKLQQLRDLRLLIVHRIIDYFVARGIDINKDLEVRPPIHRLKRLAARLNFTILSSATFNKQATIAPKARVQGASGFVELAAAVWVLAPDPEQAVTRRLMLNMINELAPPGNYNASFRTINIDGFPAVEFDRERVNVPLGAVMGGFSNTRGPKPVKGDIVRDMLRHILRDGKEHPANEIIALIKKAHVSESLIQEVAKDYVDKNPDKKNGGSTWKLKTLNPDSSTANKSPD